MAKSYFVRLCTVTNLVAENIKRADRGTKEYDRWLECQKVLEVVINYALNRGTRASSRQKIRTYWNCGCDFRATVNKLNDGTTYDVLRCTVSRESKILYNELGTVILEFIQNGKPVDAHVEFVVRTKTLVLTDVIPREIVSLLPCAAYNANISISDCTQELKILKAISFLAIRDLVEKADKDKLAHLLAVMKGDADYSSLELQKGLWGYLIGKDELKAMLNDLKVRNLID